MKNLIYIFLILGYLPFAAFFPVDVIYARLAFQEELYLYMLGIFFFMAAFFSFFVLPYTVLVWRSFKTRIMMNYTFVYFSYIFVFGIFIQLICAMVVIHSIPGLMKDNYSMFVLQCISWLIVLTSVMLTKNYNIRHLHVVKKRQKSVVSRIENAKRLNEVN
jgi:hypothetical protein